MRHLIVIITAMVLACSTAWGKSDKYAQATFPKVEYDLGQINEKDGVVTCEFEVYNTGNEPMAIIDVERSCGCTVADFPKKPVKPGEKAVIKIKFNPAGYVGGFLKTVNVKTSGRVKSTQLRLIGTVNPKWNEQD